MKKTKRLFSLFLIILIISAAASGCSKSNGVYRVLKGNLAEEEFAVGFRSGDRALDYVEAAMRVLAADGTASELSRRWFGEDRCTMPGDASALEAFSDGIPQRTLIMGLDTGSEPMSFIDSAGNYTGFDVEFAQRVCSLLGWELKFQPIKQEDVAVELGSGNVDCAWGAMSFSGAGSSIDTTGSYMKNEKVLVVLDGSDIKRTSGLSGAVLGTTFDSVSTSALESNAKLRDSLDSIKRMGSVSECFASLNSGACHVILVDSVSAEYFMR